MRCGALLWPKPGCRGANDAGAGDLDVALSSERKDILDGSPHDVNGERRYLGIATPEHSQRGGR